MKSNSKTFMKMSIISMLMLVLIGIFSMPVFAAENFSGAHVITEDTEYKSRDLQIQSTGISTESGHWSSIPF